MDVAYRPIGLAPGSGSRVDERRYLVVANHTLGDPVLIDLIRARCVSGRCRLHVLVPHQRRLLPFIDPVMGVPMDAGLDAVVADHHDLEAATGRLHHFLRQLCAIGLDATGEVVTGDPVAAARRAACALSFDEIIVSTLPPGLSAWLRLDLPARIARAFDRPVVTVTQRG